MKRIALSLSIILAVAIGAAQTALAQDEVVGWWSGDILYRGDNLLVRVHITRDGHDNLVGTLDIPDLVYAGEAVPVAGNDGYADVTVDFPFGLGEIPFRFDGPDRLQGLRDSFETSLTREGPPPYRRQDVVFESETGQIEGTLYIPRAEGDHPAVVIAAGANNASRDYWSYSSWADYFARHGIAAFVYDRTEDGDVLDDGTIVTIEVQAEEFADAVRYVRSRPGIDSRRVGVAGASRGAWMAMYAAAHIDDPAFVILNSGSPLTPAEQTIAEVRARVFDATGDWDLVSRAEAYMRLYFYVAATGEGWNLLEREIQTTQAGGPLRGFVDEPRRIADLDWWHENLGFRPEPLLAGISAPVLGLWGANDLIAAPSMNAPLMQSALPGGAAQLTTHVYANADHRLELPLGETEEGEFHWFAVAPVQEDDIIPWLRANGILR